MPRTGDQILARYFKCIDSKDLDGILDLFDYDAVIYEPFSKAHELHGRSEIKPFLKVAMMANSKLHHKIKIQKPNTYNDNNNKIIALITFEKGEKIKSKFTFEFTDNELKQKRIKSLRIEFL